MAQKVRIADLLALTADVEIVEGKPPITVRPLALNEIIGLIMSHKDTFLAMYVEAQAGKKPDFTTFLAAAPDLVARIILIAGEFPEEEFEDIKKMGLAQLPLLVKIWDLTVPDAKKLGEAVRSVLERLANLRKTVEEGEKPAPGTEVAGV